MSDPEGQYSHLQVPVSGISDVSTFLLALFYRVSVHHKRRHKLQVFEFTLCPSLTEHPFTSDLSALALLSTSLRSKKRVMAELLSHWVLGFICSGSPVIAVT